MTISLDVKVPMLIEFHSYLYQPEWKYMESKEKHRQVLEDFPTVRHPPPPSAAWVALHAAISMLHMVL